MKISDISNKFAIENYAKTVRKDVLPGFAQKCDRLELNETSRMLSEAVKAVKEARDVSEEKVREIAARINNGTYDIKSIQVAEKILDRRSKGV